MPAVASLALAAAPATAATKLPQPVLGAWKFRQGAMGAQSGFTKVFTRGGYSTWGIGRNVGGEAEPMAVHAA